MFKKIFEKAAKKVVKNKPTHNNKPCSRCNLDIDTYKRCHNCGKKNLCLRCFKKDKILCKECEKEYIKWQKKLEKLKNNDKENFIIGDDEESEDISGLSSQKSLDFLENF